MAKTVTRLGNKGTNKKSPWPSNFVGGVGFTVGVEAGNAINVALQLLGADGYDLEAPGSVFVYLADDALGQAIAASAPSGGWAIGTDGLLIPVVANKAAHFVSEADGDIDITITESTAKDFWVCVILPSGELVTQKVTFA